MDREAIVKEALSWSGTPYQHQVGLKGVGVDCAYLVGKVAESAGLIDEFKVEPYSVEWHLHSREEKMCNIVESFGCVEISCEDIQPADILIFKYGRVGSHMGIYIGRSLFIHAHLPSGKVLLNSLSGDYLKRLHRVYKFPTF